MNLILPGISNYTKINPNQSALLIGYEPELSVMICDTDGARMDRRDYMYDLGSHAVAFISSFERNYAYLECIINEINDGMLPRIPIKKYADDQLIDNIIEIYLLKDYRYLLDIRCNLTKREDVVEIFIAQNKSYILEGVR